MDSQFPIITIIIPTYNRPAQLIRLLQRLAVQSLPAGQFEVIAVDDGSSEDYAGVQAGSYPFAFTLLRQSNAGEAIARNHGVEQARAGFIVFLDDDMLPESGYLQALADEHAAHSQALLLGNMRGVAGEQSTLFRVLNAEEGNPHRFGAVPLTEMAAGVLALSRQIYLDLGGMHPIPDKKRGGWIDLEFSYRAHQAGFSLHRVGRAVVYHDDYVINSLQAACQRMEKVSRLAPALFERVPGLAPHVAMFRDKTPIRWGEDGAGLIVRKLVRGVASTRLSAGLLMGLTRLAERLFPRRWLLKALYRWVIGGYIYRGYRAGLREIDQIHNEGKSAPA